MQIPVMYCQAAQCRVMLHTYPLPDCNAIKGRPRNEYHNDLIFYSD